MANKALLVGINAYPAPNELNGCINDIDDMTAYLTSQRGFRRAQIKRIADAQATTANILAALERFATSLSPEQRTPFWWLEPGETPSDNRPWDKSALGFFRGLGEPCTREEYNGRRPLAVPYE